MKEFFVETKFRPESLLLISKINAILDEYAVDNYDLSVRQVYYQLVARGEIPNHQKQYKRLVNLINNGRNAGLIDWDMIVDRGRGTIYAGHWKSPAEIARMAAKGFQIDKWADQPFHIEVMVEKQALEGVLERVCRGLDVRLTANKGYSSSSFMYHAAKRIYKTWIDSRVDEDGEIIFPRSTHKKVVVLYLGDHDPSGLDMDRDILERLNLYADNNLMDIVEVKRLALLYSQIEELDPPENPTKMTDSRAGPYVAEYGHSSWELDAVEPRQLAELVTTNVEALRNEGLWIDAKAREEKMREELTAFADTYEENQND